MNWLQDNLDNTNGYKNGTISSEDWYGYTSEQECIDDANLMWNGGYLKSTSDEIIANAINYSLYPYGWWDSFENWSTFGCYSGPLNYVIKGGSSKNPTYSIGTENVSGEGYNYADILYAVNTYDSVTETTLFNPEQIMVVEAYVEYSAGFYSTIAAFDPQMLSGSQTTPLCTETEPYETYGNSDVFQTVSLIPLTDTATGRKFFAIGGADAVSTETTTKLLLVE